MNKIAKFLHVNIGDVVKTVQNSHGTKGILKRENSAYGNKKWNVIVDLPNGGKHSQFFSTQREAEDYLDHFSKKDPNMYSQKRD